LHHRRPRAVRRDPRPGARHGGSGGGRGRRRSLLRAHGPATHHGAGAGGGAVLRYGLPPGGPGVIEAVVDPFEPPMPPKITTEQALMFARSLLRGEPNREKIALTVLADKGGGRV